MNLYEDKNLPGARRRGVALIFTMIVLVLLTALVYQLSSAVSQWKHRMQYMIDYQTARYACESGLKYALSTIGEADPNYISRPNEPDFSDLFTMSDEDYKQMMEDWAKESGAGIDVNNLSKNTLFTKFLNLSRSDVNDSNNLTDSNSIFETNDTNDINDANGPVLQEPNELYVRGPYGPAWPYITKPVEIEFGDARITIEIIDENAKLPLVWGICADANTRSESKAAIQTFCEWMQMEPNAIDPLIKELDQMKEVKPFSIALKPVVTTVTKRTDSNSVSQSGKSASTSRRTSRTSRRAQARKSTVQQTRPDIGHTMDFAKLLHSPMIDLETLARPVNKDDNRTESALKYIGLWGTQKVNINSAPRQVLEAAFTFGGDAPEIAEQIITMRKEKPFSDIDDLTKRLYRFNSSIDKVKPYITAKSDCFTIRVKATSGLARVCATAGIKKEDKNVQQIGIIME
ncbi:MAG: type II secretion system protein GspK [Phycisphaerae bacterium]|jgi:hypothetical protein